MKELEQVSLQSPQKGSSRRPKLSSLGDE
jgi:hypothetical protein